MLATKLIWFYLCLVAFSQVISSTRVNKTSSDGKVFISGDHNEVFLTGTAREIKIALVEIKGVLKSVKKKDDELSKKIQTLEKQMFSVNKSNVGLFAQVEVISQRVAALEGQASNFAMLFPRKGTSDYVITRGMRSVKAVTFCLWMKTADKGNEGVPLSYAVSATYNEVLLYNYKNFNFVVKDSGSSGPTSVSVNDGNWHHICATWENTAGSWMLYKDGKVAAAGKGLQKGHVIRGGGALVLGQEQDNVGGSFQDHQSFVGEMTGVNIWDHVIEDEEIKRMSKSCLAGAGNVFQWSDFKPHLKGSVEIIKPSC